MPEPTPYGRVLLKLSGEALLGEQSYGIDPGVVDRLTGEIAEVLGLGIKIGVVVGGGNIFRGIEVARSGGHRVTGDQLGMLATVMNAIALRDGLKARQIPCRVFSGIPVPTICETFTQRAAETAFEGGDVTVFAGGTGNPFFTTDSAAALRAAELDCDVLMKGTQVDGVYSSDPKKHSDAVRFDRLTHSELLEKGLKVMDAAAVALARENSIPIVVFSILQPGALIDILTGGGRATIVSGG